MHAKPGCRPKGTCERFLRLSLTPNVEPFGGQTYLLPPAMPTAKCSATGRLQTRDGRRQSTGGRRGGSTPLVVLPKPLLTSLRTGHREPRLFSGEDVPCKQANPCPGHGADPATRSSAGGTEPSGRPVCSPVEGRSPSVPGLTPAAPLPPHTPRSGFIPPGEASRPRERPTAAPATRGVRTAAPRRARGPPDP